jgi:glycosyltransferase involved in cell wall biosynthesis
LEQRQAQETATGKAGTATILFVGRLEKRKGIDPLLNAIPLVLARAPEAEFVLIGQPINAELHKQVKRACDACNGRVRYLGPVSDEALLQAYAEADVFVAPSEYESFGLIYVEAMRFGVPCIGCNAGGASEVIDHGRAGLVVPVDAAETLAEAIVELIKNREKREAFGKHARRRYEAQYALDVMIDRLENVYAG